MNQNEFVFPLAAGLATAFVSVATIFLTPGTARAGSATSGEASCSCPEQKQKLWSKPKFADLRSSLDETDEIAALESVQFALSEVGDGASFTWRRNNGRISGKVNPLSSFKDPDGNVCRHLVLELTSGEATKKTEGVACRQKNGVWQLEG